MYALPCAHVLHANCCLTSRRIDFDECVARYLLIVTILHEGIFFQNFHVNLFCLLSVTAMQTDVSRFIEI